MPDIYLSTQFFYTWKGKEVISLNLGCPRSYQNDLYCGIVVWDNPYCAIVLWDNPSMMRELGVTSEVQGEELCVFVRTSGAGLGRTDKCN